jgi:hypothetical protein
MQHFWDTIPGLAIGAVSLVLGMLMGAAYSPVVSEHRSGQYKVKLADALQTACLETDWRVLAKLRSFFGPRRRTPDADDPKNAIVLGGVASVMAVALYVPRAYVIANVLILASIAIAAGTAFVFVVLYKRDVVNGGGLVRSVLFSYLLTAVGVLCGIWLIHPRTGSTALSQLAGSLNQGRGLFENGFDSFFFVLYQLIGAIAIAFVLVVAAGRQVALITGIYVHYQSRGLPAWKFLFWATSFSIARWTWVPMIIFVGLALVMTGGDLYTVIGRPRPEG